MGISAKTKGDVMAALRHWFGIGNIAEVRSLDPECFQVRLTNGGTVLAIVEDDGSISIREMDLDGIC